MLRLAPVVLLALAAAVAIAVAGLPVASARPKPAAKLLGYAEAQTLVLGLINDDRKKAGLRAVVLDDAASKAGLEHARDMATRGFTGHLGSDGSTPEQRYTQSGGSDFVQENAACLFDTIDRRLDLDLGAKPGPGSYAVTIWAKKPSSPELFMVSMRTVTVR